MTSNKELLNDIMSLVDRILNSKISNIVDLLPDGGEQKKWADATNYGDKTSLRQWIPDQDDRASHVYRRLGQITVNPHDIGNSNALLRTYVYHQPDGVAVQGKPNFNPESATLFLDELIQDVKNRFYHGNSTGLVAPLLELYGKRGSGKTFFLNHLFTKFCSLLDKERIIWVRINLVAHFGDFKQYLNDDNYLFHWMTAQATKIVLRYYDPASDDFVNDDRPPIHASEYLKKTLEGADIESAQLLAYIFQNRKAQERPISPSLISKLLGQAIVTCAHEADYKFIFILDGFDRLETIPYETDRYDFLNRQYEGIAAANNVNRKFAVVAVRRTTTRALDTILHDRHPSNFSYIHQYHREWLIESIPIEQIVERRITFLKDEIDTIAQKKHGQASDAEKDQVAVRWPLIGNREHLLEFDVYFHKIITEDIKRSYENLETCFGENRRAQMQVVQFAYYDFIKGVVGGAYRMIEFLSLAGAPYPVRPYYYKLTAKKKTPGEYSYERLLSPERRVDHHLLPAITLFPYSFYDDRPADYFPPKYGIVAGIAILMIISAHEEIVSFKSLLQYLDISDIEKMLSMAFDIPRYLTRAIIEEYAEFEIISLSGEDGNVRGATTGLLQIKSMPKMAFILNGALLDLAYLNMCAMRIPLKESVLGSEVPYFSAMRLDHLKSQTYGLADWISVKITNSLGLYRIFRALIESLESSYLRKKSVIDNRLSEHHKRILERIVYGRFRAQTMSRMEETLRKKLRTTIEGILKQAETVPAIQLARIFNNIGSYNKKWIS